MSPLQRKLLRDLKASKWQFMALSLVLVLGIAGFGAMYTGYDSLDSSYRRTYDTLKFADLTVDLAEAPARVLDDVQDIPGVEAAGGRLVQDVPLLKPGSEGELVLGRIISVPIPQRPSVNDVLIEEGSYLKEGDEVLVDREFAEAYDLHPGDQIHFLIGGQGFPFEVRGVVTSPEYLWMAKNNQEILLPKGSFGVLFLPHTSAGALLGEQDTINNVCLLLEEDADPEDVISGVEEVLSPYGITALITQEEQPSNALLEMDLEGFREMALFVPFFFLLVTAIIMYVLLTRIVHAQRGQIGLMRAEGYTRGQVMRHYLSFALMLGVVGSALGAVVGYLLGRVLTTWYASIINIPFVEVQPDWWIISGGILLGLLFCAAAGVIPAWNASRLSPAEAMRLPPPPVGRTPIVERALPFLSKLPYAFKIPLRNLFRAPRRTVYTIVGIAFSVSLILSSMALMDTATETMNLHFDEVQAYDLKATFSTPQSDLVSQMEGWDGVEKAEPILEAPCRLKSGDETYSTMLVGLDPEGRLYQLFPASEGAGLTGDGILIGGELAQRLGVSVGDSVDIETEAGARQSKVAGLVNQPLGSLAYLSLEGVRNLLGLGDSVSGALLKIREGKLEEVKSQLYGLEQTAGVEDPEETKESVSELMDFSYEFMGVMLLFGGALAFAIVFNTVTVNILERSREIATMRTLGAGMGKIGMMLTLENLLTGALGMALGVVLGYMLSLGYVKMFESEFLSFELAVYGRTYAITTVTILLILLLSQLPGVRYLSRLNLAKVTKEQSM